MELKSVRFLKLAPGGAFITGDIAGIPEAKAERWIAAGYCEPYEPEPEAAESGRKKKRRPKGLDQIDRMVQPEHARSG